MKRLPKNSRWGAAKSEVGCRRTLALLCACLALVPGRPLRAEVVEESVPSDFGMVRLIHPEDSPKGLLIYVTGAGGWDPATDRTARGLADQAYLVAGVEPCSLRAAGASGACRDLGTDLMRLTQWVRTRAPFPRDSLPVLVGEGEGASLVYAALLQSPPHSFHAALTLDFCPSLRIDASLCPVGTPSAPVLRDGRPQLAKRVESTWFALATDRAAVCPSDEAAAFVARVDNARLVSVGGGPTPAATGAAWLAHLTALLQWLDPRIPDQVAPGAASEEIAGLPLTEVLAEHGDRTTFAVMLSGDGGWAALDRGVSAELAAHGIGTVGWDSLGYFWTARSPEEASRDLARVLRRYLSAWDKGRVVLIGYSFGADVLPFLANRLPPDLRASVALVVLLGASPRAAFEFHLGDWLSPTPTGNTLPVAPELLRLDWTKRLCIYAEDEEDSICPGLSGAGAEVRRLSGDHHFDGDYAGVADVILTALRGGVAAERASGAAPARGPAAGRSLG